MAWANLKKSTVVIGWIGFDDGKGSTNGNGSIGAFANHSPGGIKGNISIAGSAEGVAFLVGV